VFEKLSKLLPEDSEVCNLMGVALSGAGKKLEAIKSWEKSLSLQPDQEKVKEMISELKKTCAEEEKK
jgi:Flp pilus assembly protein TadD